MGKWSYLVLGSTLMVLLGATGVVAHQTTPAGTPGDEAALPVVVWQLTAAMLADGTVHRPEDPSRYTIQFLPDGRVEAQADCNQVAGSYEIDGDELTLSNLMTTLIGCPAGSLGSEYGAWLGAVEGYELTEDSLILSLDDGGTLHFAPSLPGVVWEWQEFLNSNDTAVAPEDPKQYTLRFQADGAVLVQADCNRGGGRYTVDGPMIAIEQVGLTRMACPDGSLGDEFVGYLDEVTSFTFADGRLSLALPMDGGFLLFQAGEDAPPPATPIAATPVSE